MWRRRTNDKREIDVELCRNTETHLYLTYPFLFARLRIRSSPRELISMAST